MLLQHPLYCTRLLLLAQERHESRCALISDSCTFAWHTGQLTISAGEEDEEEEGVAVCSPAEERMEEAEEPEEEAAAVLWCIAGEFVFADSLEAAESLAKVFWKKLKMAAELLRSSHGLFLDA